MSVFAEAFWQMFGWVVGFFTSFATVAVLSFIVLILAGGMAGALGRVARARLNNTAPKRNNVEEFRPERRR